MKMAKNNTDDQILKLINEVKTRKAEIAKLEKPNWKTNCSFSYVQDSLQNSTNLHVESNISKLVSILAFLVVSERNYNTVSKDFNIDAPDFQWNGYSVADWTEDIKLRIEKINITTKRKKLDELECRLSGIITPELKAKLELEAITAELS